MPGTASDNPTLIQNPLLRIPGELIDFGSLQAGHIHEAVSSTLESCTFILDKIIALNSIERSYETVFGALDNFYNLFGNLHSVTELLSNVHPENELRETALENLSILSRFYTDFELNEPLYKALKEYSVTAEVQKLTGYQKKFINEVIRNFEREGLGLTPDKRSELKELRNKLSDLEIEFSDNIETYSDELIFTETEIDGLPADYLNERRLPDGTYKIDLSYPSYQPFMKYARNDEARKKLYFHFTTRAPKNKTVISRILRYRDEQARLLGFSSFAAYALDDQMAKNPETVWEFENKLRSDVLHKAQTDYKELLELKTGECGSGEVIQPWQSAYYSNKLLENKYSLDNQKLKEYFELNRVLEGIFSICEILFQCRFREVTDASVWHPEVRLFDVERNGNFIAHFYLDLFPRKNKFSHAACFGIAGGKKTDTGYQKPSAALVCNFPKPSKEQPSLLLHDDVETLFHEFGHVLHHLLTRSELYFYSGTNVSTDFVEVPSQLFENWAWEYESLSLFARHYQSGEALPMDMHKKMIESKNAGSGLFILQQIFYGILDMTFHDKYLQASDASTTETVRKLQNEITLYPFLEGTHMETSFGHLNGYAAGYYGYLWAKVYADDIFSEFKKNGVLNSQTGKRLADIILASGATRDELSLVKEFLGRDPDSKAFLIEYGIISE